MTEKQEIALFAMFLIRALGLCWSGAVTRERAFNRKNTVLCVNKAFMFGIKIRQGIRSRH